MTRRPVWRGILALLAAYVAGMVFAGWLDRMTIAKNQHVLGQLLRDNQAFRQQAQEVLTQLASTVREVQTQQAQAASIHQAVLNTQQTILEVLNAKKPEEQPLWERVRTLEQIR